MHSASILIFVTTIILFYLWCPFWMSFLFQKRFKIVINTTSYWGWSSNSNINSSITKLLIVKCSETYLMHLLLFNIRCLYHIRRSHNLQTESNELRSMIPFCKLHGKCFCQSPETIYTNYWTWNTYETLLNKVTYRIFHT